MIRRKQFFLLAISLFMITVCQAQKKETDWAQFGRYAEANKTVAVPAKVVFMGNSITDGWPHNNPAFFSENGYVGRGIGGQTTCEMLARFRPDVIALKPQAVVILAGTNDIAENIGQISLENIFGNIVSMCELAKINGIVPILCSVLPVYDYPWRPGMEPAGKINTLNAMIKKYAAENGWEYVDYHSAMKDEKDGLPEKYANDGVHPTKEGYAVMENLVKKHIDKVAK